MIPPVSFILVLCVVVTSLVPTQRQARPGVSHTSHTGEKEEAVGGRVSLLRASRAYRRFGGNNRLQMSSRQPYKKAPKRSNSVNPKTRYRSFVKDVKTASRQTPATVNRARPNANVENTRNKYVGVKFPKLDLFPQMRKTSVSHAKVLKGNITVKDATLLSQPRAGQGNETEERGNSKALESEHAYNGTHRSNLRPQNQRTKVKTASVKKNFSKSRADIRPTPSLSNDNPDNPTILAPSKEDNTLAHDLMSSISADEDGFLTVTHTVFTRTMELYEETLTSLSEVIIYQY